MGEVCLTKAQEKKYLVVVKATTTALNMGDLCYTNHSMTEDLQG